jgi:hypothetical protein
LRPLESPGGGAHGSPAWFELEEVEGDALVSAIVGTEPEGEEAQAQADNYLAQVSSPPAQQAALGGSQEWAMVTVSSPYGSTSGSVGE